MSLLEEIKKSNEEIREILPENIVRFTDDLVEIQMKAIHKTLDCADKHEIEHSDALHTLIGGLNGFFEHFYFSNYLNQECDAEEGCAGYTTEEQPSWKDSMMKHFMKGE